MSRCPYYMNGLCYSPRTIKEKGAPSRDPINLGFCLSENFYKCPYYMSHTDKSEEELYKYLGASKDNIYMPVHIIPCNFISECPFYEIKEVEEGACIARCTYLNKYITKSNAEKCIKYWKTCPFYMLGIESEAYKIIRD